MLLRVPATRHAARRRWRPPNRNAPLPWPRVGYPPKAGKPGEAYHSTP